MTDTRRVFTEQTRPFAVPDRLEELVGPEDGVISLPLHVYWGPEASVDLGVFSGIRKAYEAVLREGLIDDVRAIVSAPVLRREWKRLLLPVRIGVRMGVAVPGSRSVISEEEFQRSVAAAVLSVLAPRKFALAGSSAIREHGIIRRRTADIDLFTSSVDAVGFAEAVADVVALLEHDGFAITVVKSADLFARIEIVSPEHSVEMDLGADWREREPVLLGIGAVLDVRDAVANKVSALYSRAEARDYLDVDAIRESGRFTDAELLVDAAERDLGFERTMFARQLRQVVRIDPENVAEYGVADDDLAAIKRRLIAWADEIDAAGAARS